MKLIIITFLLFILSVNCDFETFYEFVLKKIDKANHHVRPIDNAELYQTTQSWIHHAGIYDFIIVGGGTAGSVLASRLSEIHHWKILLLEAGEMENAFSDIPAFSAYLQTSEMDWGYLTTPQTTCCQGMQNNQCVYPRGKVLGGSSVINGMIYTRGNKVDFDEWEALGNPGWSYKDVLPYFKKSEVVDLSSYDTNYHGKHGPLHVNFSTPPSVLAKPFIGAVREVGLKELDVNGKEQIGVSKIQFNVNFNKRCSASHAFIDPIKKLRENLKITLKAFAVNILTREERAYGIKYIKNGKMYVAIAKKEVILSAGSINTPQLLLLSGVGPADELTKLGIQVKQNLPGVGRNLQDHIVFINLVFGTNLIEEDNTLKCNLFRYFKGKTPLTWGLGTENIAYFNTKEFKISYPDIEMIANAPIKREFDPRLLYNIKNDFLAPFLNYNTLTDLFVNVILLKPESKGTVTLKSKSPLDFPLVDINYFSDPENKDLETMYQGIKFVLNLTKTEEFKRINATYIAKQPECEQLLADDCEITDYENNCDRDYWYCALIRLTTTTYHPTGTASMGPDLKRNVVNHNLLVHNFVNLRVVDASIIPTSIRAHINAAVYMIAEKISDQIKRDHAIECY